MMDDRTACEYARYARSLSPSEEDDLAEWVSAAAEKMALGMETQTRLAPTPEMAETIAAMREVWAVQIYANYDRFRGWKFITVEDILIDSPDCAWWHSERHVAESEAERMDDPTRIVRRLVTEPEVIE